MGQKINKQQQKATYFYDTKDTAGVKSAIGYPCPVVEACCFVIPLKIGSYIIAALGILPTIACILLATPLVMEKVHENGLPRWYCPGIKWIYGILGVFVFASHIILGVAIALRIQKLIVLYLWNLFAYMAVSFGLAMIISAETIKSGHVNFGVTFFILAAIYTLILIYFWIVINSQAYVQKEESNVINIHITII